MIYDQDDPAVAPDDVQCDANVGKIFYRQCNQVATVIIKVMKKDETKVYHLCDEHAEGMTFDD